MHNTCMVKDISTKSEYAIFSFKKSLKYTEFKKFCKTLSDAKYINQQQIRENHSQEYKDFYNIPISVLKSH